MSEVTITKKSGKGASHGVVSELSAFISVKPGHAEELHQALGRFHAKARAADFKTAQKIGIQDMRHVIFDNGTRLCWITAFDTDWDPYIDDAVAILGVDSWKDWLQHTVEYEEEIAASGASIKKFLQAAQVPASGFYRAIPELTLAEIKKGQQLKQAFEQVLDDPAAAEALQQPALKPLLEQAAV